MRLQEKFKTGIFNIRRTLIPEEIDNNFELKECEPRHLFKPGYHLSVQTTSLLIQYAKGKVIAFGLTHHICTQILHELTIGGTNRVMTHYISTLTAANQDESSVSRALFNALIILVDIS